MTTTVCRPSFSRRHACYLVVAACLGGGLCAPVPAPLPRLFPDYVGVTIPPNIAPLNFRIQEPATSYRVELRSTQGSAIEISGSSPVIRIPPGEWARLLRANAGEPLYWDISARTGVSGLTRFATVTNQIAREEIDGWLVYRLHKPIFNYYTHLGIYQRNLESFEQKRILDKDKFNGCLNCHTPLDRSPKTFAFNVRAVEGKSPMILVRSNQPVRIEKPMGYLAWHPSGRLLAFSANKFVLFFHTWGETQDIYDANSDLGLYYLETNSFAFPSPIATPDRNETWPAWSPDGRHLYFSSAARQPREEFRKIRYDLMRVSYDLQTGQWGQPELMISAAQTGRSVCQPKVSPDGRWLLVTLSSYGNFPIHLPDSDLYLMDLATRELRRAEINSDQADTWHSWSSNSSWLVFSSKRLDGLFTRPHFSYLDERGRFHKPFVLPQENPGFYGFCLDTFNAPELMHGPVTVRERDLARTIVQAQDALTPQGPAGPPSAGYQPAQVHTGDVPARE